MYLIGYTAHTIYPRTTMGGTEAQKMSTQSFRNIETFETLQIRSRSKLNKSRIKTFIVSGWILSSSFYQFTHQEESDEQSDDCWTGKQFWTLSWSWSEAGTQPPPVETV